LLTERVFASDNWGNVYCFDAQSGESGWTASVDSFVAAGSTIAVYEGKVYVGCRGSVVNKLDENTGKLELKFQAPVSTTYGSKSAPDFTNYAAFASVTLSNNLLYVTEHSDLYCLSAHTGKIQFRRNFEHYILPAIAEDSRVFVAADLWVFAYE